MARRHCLSLKEIQDYLQDPEFGASDLEDDDDSPIDVVEIPPESVDEVSDTE